MTKNLEYYTVEFLAVLEDNLTVKFEGVLVPSLVDAIEYCQGILGKSMHWKLSYAELEKRE